METGGEEINPNMLNNNTCSSVVDENNETPTNDTEPNNAAAESAPKQAEQSDEDKMEDFVILPAEEVVYQVQKQRVMMRMYALFLQDDAHLEDFVNEIEKQEKEAAKRT